MLMRPYIAHYRNKYPGGEVDSDGESYLRAYDAKGRLRVVLANAVGSVVDQKSVVGCMDAHDLSPLPKDCRVWCNRSSGLERHAEADAREKVAEKIAAEFDGRVPGVEEICGEEFQNSHKFVEQFRAEQWVSEDGAEVPVFKNPKKKAKKK